jgi:hypothetical protein
MAKCQNIKIKIIKSLDGVSIATAIAVLMSRTTKVSKEFRLTGGSVLD